MENYFSVITTTLIINQSCCVDTKLVFHTLKNLACCHILKCIENKTRKLVGFNWFWKLNWVVYLIWPVELSLQVEGNYLTSLGKKKKKKIVESHITSAYDIFHFVGLNTTNKSNRFLRHARNLLINKWPYWPYVNGQ